MGSFKYRREVANGEGEKELAVAGRETSSGSTGGQRYDRYRCDEEGELRKDRKKLVIELGGLEVEGRGEVGGEFVKKGW